MIWIILGIFIAILLIALIWCAVKLSTMIDEKDKK